MNMLNDGPPSGRSPSASRKPHRPAFESKEPGARKRGPVIQVDLAQASARKEAEGSSQSAAKEPPGVPRPESSRSSAASGSERDLHKPEDALPDRRTVAARGNSYDSFDSAIMGHEEFKEDVTLSKPDVQSTSSLSTAPKPGSANPTS